MSNVILIQFLCYGQLYWGSTSKTKSAHFIYHYHTGRTYSHAIKSTLKAPTTLYLIKVSHHSPLSSLLHLLCHTTTLLLSVIHSSSSASLPQALLIDSHADPRAHPLRVTEPFPCLGQVTH